MLEKSTVQFVVCELSFHIVKQFVWHFVSSSFEFLIRFGVVVTIQEVNDVLLRHFQIILLIIDVLKGVYENVIYFVHI